MRLWAGALFLLAATGCNDSIEDNVVGSACTQNTQCRFMCEMPSVDFPGGFCTLHCTSDAQCPHGTLCGKPAGGVCLFPCNDIVDCGFLGAGWQCKKKDRLPDGQAFVCIGD